MTLSDEIRAAIAATPQTQDQIADAAGISQPVLSRFLSGKRDIRLATADKLAEYLGLDLVPRASKPAAKKAAKRRK